MTAGGGSEALAQIISKARELEKVDAMVLIVDGKNLDSCQQAVAAYHLIRNCIPGAASSHAVAVVTKCKANHR